MPADRVDHEQLQSLVERRLFALTETRDHEWNPLVHNPGALLYALLARPFAPAAQRLDSLSRRLAVVPDALATARENLRDIPQIHLETAVGQFRGTASLVRDEIPRLLAEAPGMAAMITPPAAAAVAALEDFATWLARAGGRRIRAATGVAILGWAAGSGRRNCGTPSTPS